MNKVDRKEEYWKIWLSALRTCINYKSLKNWSLWKIKKLKIPKVLSFWHNLWFSHFYNFATHCSSPLIFQTMSSVRSNNPSLKYQRFPISAGCIDIGVINVEFFLQKLSSFVKKYFKRAVCSFYVLKKMLIFLKGWKMKKLIRWDKTSSDKLK